MHSRGITVLRSVMKIRDDRGEFFLLLSKLFRFQETHFENKYVIKLA